MVLRRYAACPLLASTPPPQSTTPGLHSRKHSPDGTTPSEVAYIQLPLTYRPRKDERLSWHSWLTCNGWFTHISGHPSAAGRAQDRESSRPRTDVIPLCHATNQTFLRNLSNSHTFGKIVHINYAMFGLYFNGLVKTEGLLKVTGSHVHHKIRVVISRKQCNVYRQQKTRLPWRCLRDCTFSRFSTTPTCDRWTDGRTDRHTTTTNARG